MPYITDIFMDYYNKSPYQTEVLKLESPLPILNKEKEDIERLKDIICFSFAKPNAEK